MKKKLKNIFVKPINRYSQNLIIKYLQLNIIVKSFHFLLRTKPQINCVVKTEKPFRYRWWVHYPSLFIGSSNIIVYYYYIQFKSNDKLLWGKKL